MNKFTVPIITAAAIAPIIAIAPNANASTTAVSTTALKLSLSSIRSSQKAAVIPLYKGQGITFNLSRTDETITNIIIDDHSEIVLITEVPLCPADADGCNSPGAKTLHLKRIDDIYKGMESRPVPKTNTPLLTIITRTAKGEVRVNTFVIELAEGTAKYHSVEVYPDAEFQGAFLNLEQEQELIPKITPTSLSPPTEETPLEQPQLLAKPPQPEKLNVKKLKQGFEKLKPKLNRTEILAIRRMLYLVEEQEITVFRAAKLSQLSRKTLVNLLLISDDQEMTNVN